MIHSAGHPDPMKFFQLRPLQAATISEISEITAASPVPESDRVNFHIGNPVQDERLKSLYSLLVIPQTHQDHPRDPLSIKPDPASAEEEKHRAAYHQLIEQAITNSTNYTPRGGFTRQQPVALIKFIKEWLLSGQEEPLSYDFGEESGQRECIIVNGGVWETIRIIFHTLSRYLACSPAQILCQGITIPPHLLQFPALSFYKLSDHSRNMVKEIITLISENSESPTFLLLGTILPETIRRQLRRISLTRPLFFIEVNNALNNLSLAREAQMLNRVIRVIFPDAFSRNLNSLTTGFLLGNATYLKVIETMQFELKGTPAAAEMDLLDFLLNQRKSMGDPPVSIKPADKNYFFVPSSPAAGIMERISRVSEKIGETARQTNSRFTGTLLRYNQFRQPWNKSLLSRPAGSASQSDHFSGLSSEEIIEIFFTEYNSLEFQKNLTDSFLGVFLAHHPHYCIDNCVAVSGSARTALSLLGYHCGIREVILPDLSWTYEHCFPHVEVVPLTPEFELDVEGIIQTVHKKLSPDRGYSGVPAVVLNNPHNATGRVFAEEKLILLLKDLLSRGIYIIDDLSYHLVVPSTELSGPKSLRQIATELYKKGELRSDHLQFLITVHSLSKTDCFAGARLAVVEILQPELLTRFKAIISLVKSNIMATFLAYLFYRNDPHQVRAFWQLRNQIFEDRMQALEQAVSDLPAERNSFGLTIQRPQGSMYPQLVIERLPSGLSLSWLASGLATRGIGLVPLTTFARTAGGYEVARKTFRLTLGGKDNAEILLRKTRRMVIDLNRMIAEEAAAYNRIHLPILPKKYDHTKYFPGVGEEWQNLNQQVVQHCQLLISRKAENIFSTVHHKSSAQSFFKQYLPERMEKIRQRCIDRLDLASDILTMIHSEQRRKIIHLLEKEFYKEDITERAAYFQQRLFDRTVHPTQMFALPVDLLSNHIIDSYLEYKNFSPFSAGRLAEALLQEYLGQNVAIRSVEEADELVADLKCYIAAEEFSRWNSASTLPALVSFWGDWDGSTRPSGQGHRLVAGVLVENVNQQARILNTLMSISAHLNVPEDIRIKIHQLPVTNRQLQDLLDKITLLTNQLEQRFRSFLPFSLQTGRIRRLAMAMHLARDPVRSLWQHNDRLERKMLQLRLQRRELLEFYFALNKQLRKTLFEFLPVIEKNLNHPSLALQAGSFRSLLRRFALTPRIHQSMITSSDPFAIDTTVHNIIEINELAGKYGNPGLVMALQISMSSDADALIALDRKLRMKREYTLRNDPDLPTPPIWLVPLFEDLDTVNRLDGYLDKLWEYAIQSRKLDQKISSRFSEMICELFIAGSDLSQQISQPAGADAFRRAKYQAVYWLAERGLVDSIRIKLGCGEPMQRQGGYLSHIQESIFLPEKYARKRLFEQLKSSTQHSTEYARSPLTGILAHRDLLTVQSNLAEQLKFIPVASLAQILHHLHQSQTFHHQQLQRASEPLQATRLQFHSRGLQELERLTCGPPDGVYDQFLKLLTKNFRQIIYGRDEDVLGIHVISYFISRAIPSLRDRPAVRPNPGDQGNKSEQLIERFARILPLSRQGSLLRAIGHNKAQTMILGLNQLTTGIFRALIEFLNTQNSYSEAITLISERILPRLPVYEILKTLRLYQDREIKYIRRLEKCFPPGLSSFLAMREDTDAMDPFIHLFQKELLKRQGLDISDFFNGNQFKPDLLPAIHPEYAVLLQTNIFNTSVDALLTNIRGRVDDSWRKGLDPVLTLPEKIKELRESIWALISDPIQQQVESFVQLALAVHSLTSGRRWTKSPLSVEPGKIMRLGTQVSQSLRGVKDDALRQFLVSVVQYLTQMPADMTELPIDIIRALQDVERIARIEEQVLSEKQQDLLRFYLLQMARWCGENG